MHNYKELDVWKRSLNLAMSVYKFSQTFNSFDRYVFSSQLSRCAISIPSNIAEGAGKESDKEFCKYLSISVGSSFELETQLLIIKETHPNKKEEINLLLSEISIIQRMLYQLRKTYSINLF